MRAIIIDGMYYPPDSSYRVSHAFGDSLRSLGMQVDICEVLSEVLKSPIKEKYDLAFYFIHRLPERVRLFKGKINILCHIEQLPRVDGRNNEDLNLRWTNLKQIVPYFHYIFDPSTTNVDFIRKQGYKGICCPWGYNILYEGYSKCTKDIDVLFVGIKTDYREMVFKEIINCSIKLYLCTDYPKREEMLRLINRSKIFLNIHKNTLGTFEAGRIICLGLSNKQFVLSEDYEDNVPLISNKHLVVCKKEEIVNKIKYYLKNEVERDKIAQQGYEFIKSQFTMTQSLEKALRQIKEIKL